MSTCNRRISYLCLQRTAEGQASHAHVHEIINELRLRGWDVALFEPASKYGRLVEFLKAQLRLWRQSRGTDILYVRSHFCTLPVLLWARARGIPVVQEVNGPYEDLFIAHPWTRSLTPLFRMLIRASLRLSSALIAVTPELKTWLELQFPNMPVHVIPNGANSLLFRPEVADAGALPQPYAIFFGALAAWQGLDTLLAAVEDANWPAEVSLVIAGDGAVRPLVEAAAKANPRVQYIGKIPYRRMPAIVAGSIVGISPQNNLGGRSSTGLSPVKVFEMLASGVPVIVSDFPGQAELVREWECGVVIPADDAQALACAVAHIYRNAGIRERMGRQGRQAIERAHSWSRRALDTSKVLQHLLADADAAPV